MKVTITDTNGPAENVVMDSSDVEDTIRPWFVDAPAEVLDAVDELGAAIRRGDHTAYDLAEFLGLTITMKDNA